MFCPYCAHELADKDQFCGACGKPVAVAPLPPVAMQETAKQRKWKPWMTVTAVVVATVAGAAIGWALLLSNIFHFVNQFTGLPDTPFSWTEDIAEQEPSGFFDGQLMRTWTMSEGDSYGDLVWWLDFGEDTILLKRMTMAGTQEYGDLEYWLVDDDTFYVPELDQSFTYEINDGGNMLTIWPGFIGDNRQEQWFNFE